MTPLDFDTLATSRFGLRLAAGIGRATPETLGHRLAAGAAGVLAGNSQLELVRAVRVNQWVASGETLTGPALDQRVRATLENMGRWVYDYHHLAERHEEILRRVVLSPEAERVFAQSRSGQPLMVAVAHLANYDLAGRALGLRGVRLQVLSVPDPTDAYRAQNAERREVGLDITPISPASLKRAAELLAAGGSVLTGIDRPITGSRYRPRFFGRPAELPTAHIRLATRSGAELVVMLVHLRDDERYEIDCRAVELTGARDDASVVRDAEAVLAVAEHAIRGRPEQWAMPHAVWPEADDELRRVELNDSGGADA